MSKPQLTPWFDGSVKPVRKGVYRRELNGPASAWYSWWDGSQWMCGGKSIFIAVRGGRVATPFQNTRWRGLSSAPKGAKP